MNNSPDQAINRNKNDYNDFMILDQYETCSKEFSPINQISPREEDSKVIDMFYKSKETYNQEHKTDDFEIANILRGKQDSKTDDKTYNSLLYFKTTEEGQQKMYDSYDYFDDLIKESKTWKFVPTQAQNGNYFL